MANNVLYDTLNLLSYWCAVKTFSTGLTACEFQNARDPARAFIAAHDFYLFSNLELLMCSGTWSVDAATN